MNRWEWNKRAILVWASMLAVMGLILWSGKVQALRAAHTVFSSASVSASDEKSSGKTSKPSNSAKAEGILSISDFSSPAQGKILRNIGNYYCPGIENYLFHGGIDYAEPEGTVIRATHGGKVVFAGQDPILGQKVSLDCGKGWTVTYGGLENLSVKTGETIESKDKIGQIGFDSGAEGSGQTQLHYEVWHNDEVQSPK